MIDVLHAALGTALAALWLMGSAWVGIRSGRLSPSLAEIRGPHAQRPYHNIDELEVRPSFKRVRLTGLQAVEIG